ncbi:MAG: hypothetical protein JKY56_09255, partial [Kofleriaceae bacterium]|nr:hypothetical protein [Kofleriaceae bacterium]
GGNVDENCSTLAVAGVFAPNVQCEWAGPPAGDPYPNHRNVLSTPTVIDFDFDGDPSTIEPSIVFVSYDGTDGGTGSCVGTAQSFGVIRIIDGDTCVQQFNADSQRVVASTPLALADLDNASDNRPEIVGHRVGGGMFALKWDQATMSFVDHWQTASTLGAGICLWSGPSIHDLNNDSVPEVIMGGSVFDGITGAAIDESLGLLQVAVGSIPVIADLQGDGIPELVSGNSIYRWDIATSGWIQTGSGLGNDGLVAVADFGTFGSDPNSDDRNTLDGIAEVVVVSGGTARLMTRAGRVIQGPIPLEFFPPAGNAGVGGPPTISDFDGDGRAEYSVAGRGGYNVYDPDCAAPVDPAFCSTMSTTGILWAKPTQDLSSSLTGSAVFDFENDGRAEVVYADECFSRVYDGQNGDILYSAFRTSCTWYENPIVADVDGDLNTEIVIPSNNNCGIACPTLDPLFDGLRCEADIDCPGATTCGIESGETTGHCRCASDVDCGGNGYVCTDPAAGPSALGQVCRAGHPGTDQQGIRVVRDTLDRWVNSRPIWNQHAYSVTNVTNEGKIPSASTRLQNWTQPGLNNFRQNIIGDPRLIGTPDLTSSAQQITCDEGGADLNAKICNRGTEVVAGGAPMSFYQGDPADMLLVCTVQTTLNLAPGECENISCPWPDAVDGLITVVADDPGNTNIESSAECHENNNRSFIEVGGCIGVN